MIYKYIAIAIAAAFLIFIIWDNGRDFERKIWTSKATVEAEKNIKVEKTQNEIRNNVPDDDAFLNVLRRGRFGKLKN